MNSLVHRTSMFLLLLVCGPALYQATSCPYLDVISLLSGRFYAEKGGKPVDVKVIPVDIPAMNQYFPLLYTEASDNQTYHESICLFVEWGETIYGSVTYTIHSFAIDSSEYRTPQLDLSPLARANLPGVPDCTENGVLNGNKLEGTIRCIVNGQELIAIGELTCTNSTSSLDPEHYKYRIATYPLPASWLIGSEDYVNLCSA